MCRSVVVVVVDVIVVVTTTVVVAVVVTNAINVFLSLFILSTFYRFLRFFRIYSPFVF